MDSASAPKVPKGIIWIMLTNLVISVNYSMLMVTGADYVTKHLGQSLIFYGAVVAAFPIGRILVLMPMGYWSDKGTFRMPFAICNILAILGGVMYGLASFAGSANLALAGRIVGGAGATQPVGAWAARAYPPAHRAKVESMQKAMNLMGVIVGPALNCIVADLNVEIGPFYLNTQTAAGYFPAVLSVIMFLGCLFGVEEPPAMEASTEIEATQNPLKVLFTSGAWVCLILAFQTNLQLAAFDTVLAELNQDQLGWGVDASSACFGVIALLCLTGAVASIVMLGRGFRCTVIIAIGLVLNMCVSVPGMWAVRSAPGQASMTLFLVMGGFQCVAILFYTGPTGGLYQQACGKQQGLLGGVYLMFFAAGRPCGSMLGGVLLNGSPMALVITVPVSIIMCSALHFAMWKRLQRTDDLALDALKASIHSSSVNASLLSEGGLSKDRYSFHGAEQVGGM